LAAPLRMARIERSQLDKESKVGANQVGRNHAGLRRRMGLFARLRSAERAMPAAAIQMANAEAHESRASSLRETLSELASKEAAPKVLAQELNARLGELDQQLDDLKRVLLERFDSIPFVALRAAIPRSVESHRNEVVALLEVLLGDRHELLERLPRVEYLITMLATEEDEGRRNIVHDPVTLTPALENFSVDTLASTDADSIAMELYQAAELDSESENFHETLRALRVRKHDVGLGCLTPIVLRAVVTYNARMFNSVESLAEASRTSDSVLDEDLSILDETLDSLGDSDVGEFVEVATAEEEEVVDEEVAEEATGESVPISVFECEALDSIIEAVRSRVQGEQVGRRGPGERIAVILDHGSLEPLESEAILAESPTSQEDIVARTTIVGLMLRDLGPLQEQLDLLGIAHDQLSDAWVRELNESFGQMLTVMLADPKAYEMTSRLSGIKTKHLLKPYKALNAANRDSVADGFASDEASAEMRKVARAASGAAASTPGASRSFRSADKTTGSGAGLSGAQKKGIAAAALVAIALALVLSNVVGLMPSDVKTLNSGSLRVTSPHLQSAYRNEKGRGGLMIGRVDSLFVELTLEEKIEAAEEMVENFEIQGIREAMLYDSRGMMQVHYAAGQLHRPRPGDRSTGHAPGEAAVRRTLSGQRLEDVADEDDEEDDFWRDDS